MHAVNGSTVTPVVCLAASVTTKAARGIVGRITIPEIVLKEGRANARS